MLSLATSDNASRRTAAKAVRASAFQSSERSARAVENIAALGEMTRGIAHDFRNILAMIASGLNIAEDKASDPEKLALALAAMREGVERGLRITNRLLGFATHQEIKTGSEDLNALLSALKRFLEYGAGPGIRVVLELDSALPKFLVEPASFNAAILNLVVNARDAMPEGGIIRISTAAVAHGGNGGDGAPDRDCARVRIHDNGIGMSPKILSKIFDPFFTTKGESGTGLGIPQVQAWMRQLGGYVAVQSQVGAGTVFDLFFPVHELAPAIDLDGWKQLDQWADEGGAIAGGAIAGAAAVRPPDRRTGGN